MLVPSLVLTAALNAIAAGTLNAPEAEHLVTRSGQSHHVADPDGLLGLDPMSGTSLRIALGRVGHQVTSADGWALLLPRPGRLAGLRGTRSVTAAALEAGAAVVPHAGGAAWIGHGLGADRLNGVQWTLHAAQRPLSPPTPREAQRQLFTAISEAEQSLSGLDHVAGSRPAGHATALLPACYPPAHQALAERALLVLGAVDAALDAQHELLHSHAVLTRERSLRQLQHACLDALTAAVSWPQHLHLAD